MISLFAFSCRADSIYLGGYSHYFSATQDQNDKREPQAETPGCRRPLNDVMNNVYHCVTASPALKRNPVKLNKSNNLIAYERNGYEVGYFLNGYSQHTLFVEKQFPLFNSRNLSLAANAGIVYGYHGCDLKNAGDLSICPHASLELSYSKYEIQPTFIVDRKAITFAAKWKF